MKIKWKYTIVKKKNLDKLVIDIETYKNENINLKHINGVLIAEKRALEGLLDIEQQNTRMLK